MPAGAALGPEAQLPPGAVGAEAAEPGEDRLTLIDIRSSSSSEGEGKVSNTLFKQFGREKN